jgi:hypothetical protein
MTKEDKFDQRAKLHDDCEQPLYHALIRYPTPAMDGDLDLALGIPTWHSDAWQDPRSLNPPIDVRDTPQRQCATRFTESQTVNGNNNGILSRRV